MPKNKLPKVTNGQAQGLRPITGLKASLLIGGCLMLAGMVLFCYQLISTWRDQQTSAATMPLSEVLQTSSVDSGEPYISGTPVHIQIPSVNIDLAVIPGDYNPKNNSWTLSLDKAQWGKMTQPANDKKGMTFIYAHYRKGVFASLPKIQPGATAHIMTDKGHTFTYTFLSATVTSPTDTRIFTYQGPPILILQTCSGAWYQNRQLFYFELTSVE